MNSICLHFQKKKNKKKKNRENHENPTKLKNYFKKLTNIKYYHHNNLTCWASQNLRVQVQSSDISLLSIFSGN